MRAIIFFKLLALLTILFTDKLLGQSEYAKYIVTDSFKKTVYLKSKGSNSRINYLGVIKNSKGDTLYYVFTDFTTIQAAITMHGHSNIIYLNKKLKEIKRYDVNLPENLPYKLVNNMLYFKYFDRKANKKQVFINKVGTALPTIMCWAPDDCN